MCVARWGCKSCPWCDPKAYASSEPDGHEPASRGGSEPPKGKTLGQWLAGK